jgi:hypothetical protein
MFFKSKPKDNVRMRVLEFREAVAEVFIEAEPKIVWDHHSEVRNYNQWSKMFRIVDSVPKLEKPGDWYDYELTILGIPIKGRMVSCYRVPYQKTEGCLISRLRGGGSWVYEPVHGGTRLIWTIWSEMPDSHLGRIVDKYLLAETTQKQMDLNLTRFKAFIEGKPLPD